MKSKIVKQFGAMLLAGTMIVTSGNVTTYAAEQTDESQEVDVNTESETQQDALYAEAKSDEDAEVMQDEQNQELYGITDGLFIIVANYLYSILNCRARGIKDSIIRLEESRYKGIDYYLKAHTSIFQIIWAFIITIFMR